MTTKSHSILFKLYYTFIHSEHQFRIYYVPFCGSLNWPSSCLLHLIMETIFPSEGIEPTSKVSTFFYVGLSFPFLPFLSVGEETPALSSVSSYLIITFGKWSFSPNFNGICVASSLTVLKSILISYPKIIIVSWNLLPLRTYCLRMKTNFARTNEVWFCSASPSLWACTFFVPSLTDFSIYTWSPPFWRMLSAFRSLWTVVLILDNPFPIYPQYEHILLFPPIKGGKLIHNEA